MLRKFAVLTAVLLLLSAAVPAQTQESNKLDIVCTTFPVYDWMRQILGSRRPEVNLSLMQDSGIDLHNYQPTVLDFITLSSADLFIYVGGLSDAWAGDAVKEALNQDILVLNLMDAIKDAVKTEEIVEGMQPEHDHDEDEHDEDEHEEDEHEEDEHENDEHEHEERDEHIWLSLRNAQMIVTAMKDALILVDPDHASLYGQNAQLYNAQLNALDAEYEAVAERSEKRTLLFGDRFPFRYLMDDYGITYYAAFPGCSAETEASFETITFLSGKVDELGLTSVMVLDGSDQRIAQAVINASQARNAQVLKLDSIQSVNALDIREGASYLDMMRKNLEVIKQALLKNE